MAKEIKSKERSSRRQYMKVDNTKQKVAKPNERKSAKSATGKKHHNPSQEKSSKRERREPRPEKQIITMTSTELLHPISGGIINSGIKYIMFPLHFLRYCLFGTNSVSENLAICEVGIGSKNLESSGKNKNKDEKENISSKSKDDRQAKNDESSKRRSSEESLKNTRSGSSTDTRNAGSSREKDSKEVRKGHDEGLVERPLVVVVEEDSDSSSDRWSTASSMMIEDVSMDIDRSISLNSLVEPMDISMEEYTQERLQIVMGSREKQNSTLSLDSEMARIFQKQCTSSDDDSSSNILPEKYERPGGKNFLCHARTRHSAATVPLKSKEEEVIKERKKKTSSEEVDKERKKKTSSEEVDKERKKKTSEDVDKERKKKTSEEVDKERKKKTSEEVDKERKKKTSEELEKERKKKISSEDVTHHKRRKVSQEEDRPEKQRDGKSDAKRCEEKQPSKLDTCNNSKTQSPKTPVKSKESKQKDVEYKETATQTDSTFSDDDVEMIPVDAKLPERRYCCKYALYRSHPNLYLYKEHDWNYVADNEDSNDGFARITRKRVSSSSTSSSSSTDLGFDEQGTPPESDIGTGRWHANAHDTITSRRISSRAPPGFPETPQNPPLLSYRDTDWYKVTTTSLQSNPNDMPSSPTVVPRAPAPMRHLYYDYPEFMDLPTTINSSNVLDILKENYYR